MTKRFLTVLAMLSIAAMMMLSSCSDIGTETGTETGTNTDFSLIGKWEMEKENKDEYSFIVEITADDKAILIDKYENKGIEAKYEFNIKSVDGKEITIGGDNGEMKVRYKDLSADSVKFAIEKYGLDNYQEFKKVF